MADANFITAEHLRDLFHYDPESGIFTHKRPAGRWQRIPAGSVPGGLSRWGYWRIGINGRRYAAHRLAWLYVHGVWPVGDIDHINGDRLDNRIANLRDVDRSINMQNLRRARSDNKSTGLLGASLHKRTGTYTAHIQTNGKQKNLGYFKTPEEAHKAYVRAKRVMHPGCTI